MILMRVMMMRLRRDEVCIGGRSWCWQLPIRGTKLLLTVGKCCQTFSAKQSCQGHKFEFCTSCFLALIDMVEVKVHLKITDNMWEKNTINPHLRLSWEYVVPLSHNRNFLQMSWLNLMPPHLLLKLEKPFPNSGSLAEPRTQSVAPSLWQPTPAYRPKSPLSRIALWISVLLLCIMIVCWLALGTFLPFMWFQFIIVANKVFHSRPLLINHLTPRVFWHLSPL